MTPAQANQWGFSDGQEVSVSMRTMRPITFDGVVIRVSDEAGLAMHIDFDEANACMFKNGNTGVINALDKTACSVASLNRQEAPEGGSRYRAEEAFYYGRGYSKSFEKHKAVKLSIPKNAILSAPAKDYVNKEKITLMYI